jgi:hypothetical protein
MLLLSDFEDTFSRENSPYETQKALVTPGLSAYIKIVILI